MSVIISGSENNGSDCRRVNSQRMSIGAGIVRKISINCDGVNVWLQAGNTRNVEAHLFGNGATEKGRTKFNMFTFLTVLTITAVLQNNCHNDFWLEITIPQKEYRKIEIKNKNGNITVGEDVKTRNLELHATGGNVTVNANCRNVLTVVEDGDSIIVH